MASSYDPFDSAWREDPYPAYRELRNQSGLHWAPESRLWCVSRYDDVQTVLKNPDAFSSRAMFTMLMNNGEDGPPPLNWATLRFLGRLFFGTWLNPLTFATARNLIAEDGERHTALRAVVNRGFTPSRILAWAPRVHQVVDECMKRRSEPDFDLMADLAIPLPVTIIAEMLGIEPERRAEFKSWSDTMVDNMSGAGRAEPYNKRFSDTLIGMTNYVARVARERRERPADDLISVIVAQQEGEADLTVREVMQFVVLLLIAGNETTTNLIGNGVSALLEHPDQLAALAADTSKIPAAVDEALRYDSPIQLVFRKATRDIELAGTRVPQGANLAVLLGAANRDERQFPDPDRFDLQRDTRGHIGFGFGKHFCLGSSLARLEAEAALEALAPELPRLERLRDKPTHLDSFLVRGVQELPLRRAA